MVKLFVVLGASTALAAGAAGAVAVASAPHAAARPAVSSSVTGHVACGTTSYPENQRPQRTLDQTPIEIGSCLQTGEHSRPQLDYKFNNR